MALIVPRCLGVTWADSFTRANQSALGNGWTLGNGTTQPAINSNTAAATTTTSGYYPALFGAQARTDRYYVQVLLAGAPTTAGVAVLIRCNPGFTQQVAAFVSSASTSTAILWVKNATASSSTTEASTTGTWSSGQYLTLTAAGNVYTQWRSSTPAWWSGTNTLSWTDSGGSISTGLGNRWGGIAVQYTPASAPVSNFVMADY